MLTRLHSPQKPKARRTPSHGEIMQWYSCTTSLPERSPCMERLHAQLPSHARARSLSRTAPSSVGEKPTRRRYTPLVTLYAPKPAKRCAPGTLQLNADTTETACVCAHICVSVPCRAKGRACHTRTGLELADACDLDMGKDPRARVGVMAELLMPVPMIMSRSERGLARVGDDKVEEVCRADEVIRAIGKRCRCGCSVQCNGRGCVLSVKLRVGR